MDLKMRGCCESGRWFVKHFWLTKQSNSVWRSIDKAANNSISDLRESEKDFKLL